LEPTDVKLQERREERKKRGTRKRNRSPIRKRKCEDLVEEDDRIQEEDTS